MKSIFKILVFGILATLISCSKTDCLNTTDIILDKSAQDFSDVYVNSTNLPLFADLSDYYRNQDPSELSKGRLVTLESLIDRSKIEETKYKNGIHLIQIPFKDNVCSKQAIIGNTSSTGVSNGDISEIKKFLIISEKPNGLCIFRVVTMIAESSYTESNARITYLSKGNFTGLIIYSTINGSYKSVAYSENGHIFNTTLQNKTVSNEIKHHMLYVPNNSVALTKARRNGEGEFIIFDIDEEEWDHGDGGSGGGYGHTDMGDDEDYYPRPGGISDDDTDEDELTGDICRVALRVNDARMGSIPEGVNGYYYIGTRIFVDVDLANRAYFCRWEGELSGYGQSCNYTLTEDGLFSTAILAMDK